MLKGKMSCVIVIFFLSRRTKNVFTHFFPLLAKDDILQTSSVHDSPHSLYRYREAKHHFYNTGCGIAYQHL